MTRVTLSCLLFIAAACDEAPPEDVTIADLCAAPDATGSFRLTLTGSAVVPTHPALTGTPAIGCDGGGCCGPTFYTAAIECAGADPIVLSVLPELVSTLEVVGDPRGRTIPAPHCSLRTDGPHLTPECVAMADCQLEDRVVVGRFVSGSFRIEQIED